MDGTSTVEQFKLGSLQRIADATELMAKNYQQLLNDVAYYKKLADEHWNDKLAMLRRISALKGVITKLKSSKNR